MSTAPAPLDDATAKPRNAALRPVLIGAGVVGLAIAAWATIDYERHGRYVQSTDDAYVKADAVTVAPKLAGYVAKLAVSDNQDVAAGAELLTIDPVDVRARLASAEADARVATAARTASAAAIAEAQAGVGQAEAALAAAQRDAAFATSQVARYAPLAASGAEPRERLDQLTNQRDQTAAQVRIKAAALAAARAHVIALTASVGEAEARIGTAKAGIAAASNDLAATRVTAPISGRIAASAVRLGQYVAPGQRLLTLVPTQAIYVEANYKETQIGLMRPGQPATIWIDALPGVTFHGTVDSVTPGTGATFSLVPPQNATGNFTKIVQRVPVRIRLDAGSEARKVLVPGLSLSVSIDTSAAADALDVIAAQQGHH